MITLSFYKNDNGNISYEMFFKNKLVIKPSSLGFKFSKPEALLNQFEIIKIDSRSFDESWKPVWGEQSLIRNNYKELVATLKSTTSNIIIKIVKFFSFKFFICSKVNDWFTEIFYKIFINFIAFI